MAKGQQKSNREVRKPKSAANKKSAPTGLSAVSTAFSQPPKVEPKPKKR